MNVLVGCEFSGVVRDAFRDKGHSAWSCDLLPGEGFPHLQEDVFKAIKRPNSHWDLIILHPPCTHLAVSGNRWYAGTKERDEGKEQGTATATDKAASATSTSDAAIVARLPIMLEFTLDGIAIGGKKKQEVQTIQSPGVVLLSVSHDKRNNRSSNDNPVSDQITKTTTTTIVTATDEEEEEGESGIVVGVCSARKGLEYAGCRDRGRPHSNRICAACQVRRTRSVNRRNAH